MLAGQGIAYRWDGIEAGLGRRYSFRYIPHVVIADGEGRELEALPARTLIGWFQKGTLPDEVSSRARSHLKPPEARQGS